MEKLPIFLISLCFREWTLTCVDYRYQVLGVAIFIIQAQVWCFQYTPRAYHRHSLLTTFLYFFKIFGSGGLVVSHVCLLRFHGLQPTGSSVHGICQARIPEWIDIFFSIKIFTTIILVLIYFQLWQNIQLNRNDSFSIKKSVRTKSSNLPYTAVYVCMLKVFKIYKEYPSQVDVYILIH